MLRQQVLQAWTNCQRQLTTYLFLIKHKELIKDALEFHASRASSYTTLAYWNHEVGVNTPYAATIQDLSQSYQQVIDLESLAKPITNPALLTEIQRWNSFISQMDLNQSIVKDCQDLITKLETLNSKKHD